jgi:hypothetical protein
MYKLFAKKQIPAGRGHGGVSQKADMQHFMKSERGNVAKKRPRFHALS